MLWSRRAAAGALLAGVALYPQHGLGAPAPAPAAPPQPQSQPQPSTDDGAASATQVDTGHDHDEHLTAPVMINGQGPYQFLVDTGANMSCLSRRVVDTLGLPSGPPKRMHTMVGMRYQPTVMLDRLEVGARRRHDVPVLGVNIAEQGVDGVLAIDWLKNQRLTLDFGGKRLEIAPSRHDEAGAGRVIVPARRRQGQLTIVDADLGDKRVSAMIDSGAQISLCNGALKALLAADPSLGDSRRPPQMIHMLSIVGEPFMGELHYLPFLRVGGLTLGAVPVLYSDSQAFDLWGLKDSPAVLLGMDLLSQFESVALDFGRSHVRFDVLAAARGDQA